MRESKIEQAVCEYAESQGWTVRKYVTPGYKGAPDRILRKRGKVFWIEFKSTHGGLSALQEREIQRIKQDGFSCYVIGSIPEGIQVIDNETAKFNV
jgi:hypothetical protein